jgi:hypothetical protein
MMPRLGAEVRHDARYCSRAHTRHGVFLRPAEAADVPWLSIRREAASALERVRKARNVELWWSAHEQMNMSLHKPLFYDLAALADGDSLEETVEKRGR